jgi:hypothetical protein
VCQERFSSYLCSCSVGPSRKLREEANDDDYLESIEKVEPEVEDLGNFITENLDIQLPSSDDEADS